jgi:hypothetical protein
LNEIAKALLFTLWPYGFRYPIIWWVVINVWEEHTLFIFRIKMTLLKVHTACSSKKNIGNRTPGCAGAIHKKMAMQIFTALNISNQIEEL